MDKYEPYIKRILDSETIDNKLIDFISTTKSRYLYGNGLQTAVCLGIFRDMGVEIKGVILPNGTELKERKGYWGRLMRQVKKYSMEEIEMEERENAFVMMAVPRAEYIVIETLLKAKGITDIIGCCWAHNSELNDICYDVWNEKYRKS